MQVRLEGKGFFETGDCVIELPLLLADQAEVEVSLGEGGHLLHDSAETRGRCVKVAFLHGPGGLREYLGLSRGLSCGCERQPKAKGE